MDLEELLAAGRPLNEKYKSGFATLIGRPKCGEIHSDEPAGWTENIHHLQ